MLYHNNEYKFLYNFININEYNFRININLDKNCHHAG